MDTRRGMTTLSQSVLYNSTDGVCAVEQKIDSLWRDLISCSTEEARELVSYELAQKLCMLPLAVLGADSQSGRMLTALFASPLDVGELQAAKFHVGMEVLPDCVERVVLTKAIHGAYRGGREVIRDAAVQAEISVASATSVREPCDTTELRPIPALLSAMLDRALRHNASDIHIEPTADRYRVRFRINGLLCEDSEFALSLTVAESLARRVRVLAKLDGAQPFIPQEGGFSYDTGGFNLRIRVSLMPQSSGTKLVLRLLDDQFLKLPVGERGPERAAILFGQLGLSEEQQRGIMQFLGLESGAIVLSGPTGSGKSTLLYAMLQYLNEQWRNIVTVEDPVERRIAGVNQTEVNRELGLDYDTLLPPLLRQDPDVMMIGEMRTRETAVTAITAGITGHLVLTTVHAGSCVEVISRLQELGVPPSLLASALRLVVSQRLVPRNCKHCAVSIEANEMLTQIWKLPNSTRLVHAQGCRSCGNTGVQDRRAIYEFLPVSARLRRILLSPQSLARFTTTEADRSDSMVGDSLECLGYRSLAYEVRKALLSGEIAPRYALRAVGIAPELVGY